MMKDRFGGLYSVLNGRDIRVLQDFEAWYSDYASDFIDEESFTSQEAGFSKNPSEELRTIDNLLTHSTEDILAFLKAVRGEMALMCEDYGLDRDYYVLPNFVPGDDPLINKQEILSGKAEQLRQCRHWMAKLDPIISKLTRGVNRLRNEALD